MDLIERAAKIAKEKALAKAQEKARLDAELKAAEAEALRQVEAALTKKAEARAGSETEPKDHSKFKGLGGKRKNTPSTADTKADIDEVTKEEQAPARPAVRGLSRRPKSDEPAHKGLTTGSRSQNKQNDPQKSAKETKSEGYSKQGYRGLGKGKSKAEETTEDAKPAFKPDPTDTARTAAMAQSGLKSNQFKAGGLTGRSKRNDQAKHLDSDAIEAKFEDALMRRQAKDGASFKAPISRLIREADTQKPSENQNQGPILPAMSGDGANADDTKKGGKGSSVKYSEIDLTLLREKGFITPDMPTNMMAEEFRIIKRTLLLNAFGTGDQAIESGNVLMVTSSNPNEGKSFCAINLALSIATEQDTTVLLIDADFNKPEILNRLGMRGGKGFMDVVADENLTLADCLLRTNVDNLVIMPAGRQHNRTTELLASERMKSIVHELSTRYPDRLIIFDAPPALASSVPSVLSLYVGQTIYVIAAEETSEQMIKEGLTLINKCKNINLLLNKTKMGSSNKKFATYYGYGRR